MAQSFQIPYQPWHLSWPLLCANFYCPCLFQTGLVLQTIQILQQYFLLDSHVHWPATVVGDLVHQWPGAFCWLLGQFVLVAHHHWEPWQIVDLGLVPLWEYTPNSHPGHDLQIFLDWPVHSLSWLHRPQHWLDSPRPSQSCQRHRAEVLFDVVCNVPAHVQWYVVCPWCVDWLDLLLTHESRGCIDQNSVCELTTRDQPLTQCVACVWCSAVWLCTW